MVSKVRLVGQVASTEIPAWLESSATSAFCRPAATSSSILRSPTNCRNIIVMGKTVIVSRLKAIRQYFSEDALAYFEPNNPADLSQQMVRIYRDPQLRARLAR